MYNSTCTACPYSTYNNQPQNIYPCINCPDKQFTIYAQQQVCRSDTVSNMKGSLVVYPGFYCNAGYQAQITISQQQEQEPTCSLCPQINFSVMTNLQADSSNNCSFPSLICNMGYYKNGITCTACPATTPHAVPVSTLSPADSTNLCFFNSFICNTGYYRNNITCTVCPATTPYAVLASTLSPNTTVTDVAGQMAGACNFTCNIGYIPLRDATCGRCAPASCSNSFISILCVDGQISDQCSKCPGTHLHTLYHHPLAMRAYFMTFFIHHACPNCRLE